MNDPRRAEVSPKPQNAQAPSQSPGDNVLPLRFIRKAEDHDELLTATEISRELGVYEKKLYAWVAAGAVRAYRSRFTKYTLYSKMEIIRALQLAFAVAEKAA